MAWNSRTFFTFICAVAMLAPGVALAQRQPPGSDSGAGADDPMVKYAEVLRAQRALAGLLTEAFEVDPGLTELRAGFEKAQREAMVALDPETSSRLDRMSELRDLYHGAMETERAPDIASLLAEGRQLQRALQKTAVEARKQPAVAAKAGALAEALETRFRQIDPEAFQLLEAHDGWIEAVWAALLVKP